MYRRFVFFSLLLVVLNACSSSKKDAANSVADKKPVLKAGYRAVAFNDLPDWSKQPFSGSLLSFRNSCIKLASSEEWRQVCREAEKVPANHQAARRFFEHYFIAWQMSHHGNVNGKVTGYYEPVLQGDRRPTEKARFPIYGIPRDLVTVRLPETKRSGIVYISPNGNNRGIVRAGAPYAADLSQFPDAAKSGVLKGRFDNGRFLPYFTRSQINSGAVHYHAPVLGYADNPVELFFMHIQGSGRLKTPSGEYIRLGFADKNGHSYASIGSYMAKQGYMALSATSMQSIKAWMERHPHKLAEVLGKNPSYIFFRQLDGHPSQGPIGALGVPLTGGFSAAVDKQYITLGAPLFVSTTHPGSGAVHNRLLVAQDTGSAIKGAVRVDYFWGYGHEAEQLAGRQNHSGRVWQLLPKGMKP